MTSAWLLSIGVLLIFTPYMAAHRDGVRDMPDLLLWIASKTVEQRFMLGACFAAGQATIFMGLMARFL